MFQLRKVSLLIALIAHVIKAQQVQPDGNGNTYVCVPPGYCDNNGGPGPSPGIDPRIVTPGQICPDGQVACVTQGPGSNCGNRLVSPVSLADGPAPPGVHPWQAFITNSTESVYAGSGVLIDNYHVLTAAHKVAGDVNNPSAVSVRMGVNNPMDTTNTQLSRASRIIVNPSYDPNTLKNDIAIIEVAEPFRLSQNNINTACLPGASNVFGPGQQCIVAGWGETRFRLYDQPVNPMKQVNLVITDYNTCRQSLLPTVPTVDTFLDQGTEICAGGAPNRDACTYDGGAPLMCPSAGPSANIAGLVIWGKGCGNPGVYGVYVSLPPYRNWIDSQI